MILFVLSFLFLVLLFSIFFVYILTLLPPNQGRFKYGGVYSVTSSYYHVKYFFLLMALKLKRCYEKNKSESPLKMYDIEERRFFKKIEKPQGLDEKDSIDSVYFYCTGKITSHDSASTDIDRSIDIIIRIARRADRVNEHWIMIRRDNEPLLVHQNAPDTVIANCSPNGWSTLTGLTVYCDRPNEKWTVKYHGWLKNPGNPTTKIHIDLKMSFTAFTNLFDSHKDTSLELAADAIARESWSREFFDELKNFKEKKQTHYEQWGGYTGRLTIGREESFKLRHCKGYRDHSFGIRDWGQYQRYGTFFGYLENGSCFSLGSVSCRDTLSHIRHGYYITAYGDTRPVTKHNFDLWKYFLTSPPKSRCVIEFYAEGQRFELIATETAGITFNVNAGKTDIIERFMTFTLNGERGRGVGEYCASNAVPQIRHKETKSITILNEPCPDMEKRMCVSIKDSICRRRSVSGGKGAQLADLALLAETYKEIIVPEGSVLTTLLFEKFIDTYPDIRMTIEAIKDATKISGDDEIKKLCDEIQLIINQGEIPRELLTSIVMQLRVDIGENWTNERLAVRSSSADEDALGASSAGQMDTILGVKGEDELLRSLKKCWASQYSFQAVIYRRRWGQPIDSKMAVVIMKMVPSELSGVMFTVNPLNGDTTRMIINSTFGLGEAVVSGKCEPDTIVVEICIDEELIIQSKIVGTKEFRIDMEQDISGLRQREDTQSTQMSISDEEALEVARIGLLIQKSYGEPCDIEWASNNGVIYVLQVRPITNLNCETDEELMHEFDSSLSMEEECITTSNIGEMMPMAVTPLTMSIFGSGIDRVMQAIPLRMGIFKTYLYPRRFLPSFSNHLFLNMQCLSLIPTKSAFMSDIRILFLALLGRVLEKPTKEDVLRFAGSLSFPKRLRGAFVSLRSRFQGTKNTLEWEKKFACGYKIPLKNTSEAQMKAITAQIEDYYTCWYDSIANTSQSALWSMTIMKMLEGSDGWTRHEYSQIAILLSTCSNVYSADVPTALKNIAIAICLNPKAKALMIKGNVEDFLEWIHSTESANIGAMYESFLTRHGHRCIREAEFRERSWQTDQSKLVAALKPMVMQMKEENYTVKKELTIDEAISALELSINPIKKMILKWVLKKARTGVGLREWGKSLSIKICDIFKQAFYHLGELMVKENLIPDADLVYFLTSDELVSILLDKDEPMSKFIGRVLRRRKVIERQMQALMPEISYGAPSEDTKHSSQGDSGAMLSGLPVSVGEVTGVARVIRTIEEAAHIKPGEILIVPYTDVGWTPYFPMLGGLVTEKGGLLSHGAVVAREYGLPCVVACVGATEVFHTGDNIFLNASRGTVELCTPTDN